MPEWLRRAYLRASVAEYMRTYVLACLLAWLSTCVSDDA